MFLPLRGAPVDTNPLITSQTRGDVSKAVRQAKHTGLQESSR